MNCPSNQEVGIHSEADRILRIWGTWKHCEGGVVALGYPKRSAGFDCGGASTEDSFDELVSAADRRTGAISEAILDDMGRDGLTVQVMAIWCRYYADVWRMRQPYEMLVGGTIEFLIRARRKGIAV